MSKKTTPDAAQTRTFSSTDSNPPSQTRHESDLSTQADPTIQLSLEQLQESSDPASPPLNSDDTQVLNEKNLLDSVDKDRCNTSDRTTDFDIPANMIEPLSEAELASIVGRDAAPSNQVSVHDPFQTHEAPAPRHSSTPSRKQKPFSTIKMDAARPRTEPAEPLPSTFAETAQFDPSTLRDIDAEGFHVLILRPDSDGWVQLPRDIFEESGASENAMLLLKVKTLRQD